jgi:ketopantoate reductase
MSSKAKVLLVGSGGVGTMAAYNIENGELAEVTAVLRSNYDAVEKNGFFINSVDFGEIKGWRPTNSSSIKEYSKIPTNSTSM